MPNLVTHYLCGLEAVKMIENKECKKLIEQNKNVFNLGVQVLIYFFTMVSGLGLLKPNMVL
jgi:hypothetical protein